MASTDDAPRRVIAHIRHVARIAHAPRASPPHSQAARAANRRRRCAAR
ncbi:hypothetical protein BURMUCF2_A1859 [Burkholderia multivorans CF2]|nr:hypothetical protein BURMUCF2_A1859 [Burkholderia multivorans CF2]